MGDLSPGHWGRRCCLSHQFCLLDVSSKSSGSRLGSVSALDTGVGGLLSVSDLLSCWFVSCCCVCQDVRRPSALSMEDDGPVLQSLGADEGLGASVSGPGCQELVLQEVSGLANVLGWLCNNRIRPGYKLEGCHTTSCYGVSTLVASLWPGPVVAPSDDAQMCLELVWTKAVFIFCHDALFSCGTTSSSGDKSLSPSTRKQVLAFTDSQFKHCLEIHQLVVFGKRGPCHVKCLASFGKLFP